MGGQMIGRFFVRCMLALTLVFLFAPLVIVVTASFNAGAVLSFPPQSFTTRWYSVIAPSFVDALYISLIVATGTAIVATLVGVPGALALIRGRFPGRQALNVICLSPLMVPSLVTGVALFQFSIVLWDVTRVMVGGTIIGLVMGHLTFGIPFVIRAVIAGHSRFDPSLEEAAQNLGATPFQTFRRVTLPMLGPGIVSGAIFTFLISLDDVPIALFMGGTTTTLPLKIFTTVEFSFGGDIMALATLVIGGSIVLMLVFDRLVGMESVFGARQ
jgi:putative spermidine/putrescine transport system permease protein